MPLIALFRSHATRRGATDLWGAFEEGHQFQEQRPRLLFDVYAFFGGCRRVFGGFRVIRSRVVGQRQSRLNFNSRCQVAFPALREVILAISGTIDRRTGRPSRFLRLIARWS